MFGGLQCVWEVPEQVRLVDQDKAGGSSHTDDVTAWPLE